jgi:dTDP-4-amino-4,6-dideoxygalactose transaminase
MVTTKNKDLNNFIVNNRLHGLSKDAWKRFFPTKQNKKIYFYDVLDSGYKFNMPDLNASIGLSQLKSIQNFWLRRKKIYEYYLNNFSNLPVKFQEFNTKEITHAYHLFLFHIDKKKTKLTREKLIKYLGKNKIGFGIHYRSINSMTYYKKKFNWSKNDAPIAFNVGENTISLPLYPHLSDKKVDYISNKVINFFKKK